MKHSPLIASSKEYLNIISQNNSLFTNHMLEFEKYHVLFKKEALTVIVGASYAFLLSIFT